MPLALKTLIVFVALLALAFGVVVWRAQHREAQAREDYPPIGQFVETSLGRVHALVMGDGPDVVLIHGSNGNIRDMTFALAPALADRYRVIIFDRPGLGYSDPIDANGASLIDQASALSEAATALGATKPVVVGQSYGGAVALAWAVHHPDRISGLVPLAAASNPWETPLDPIYQVTSSKLGSALVVPMLTAFVSDAYMERAVASVFLPNVAPDGYAGHVGTGLVLRRGSLRANAKQRRNILSEIRALQPSYGQITVPTEIIHGTSDDTVSLAIHSAKLVTQIPDAVLTELEGIGHMPHQSATNDVMDAIDRVAARAGLR